VDNVAKETIPGAVMASHATQKDTVTTTEAEKESTEPKVTQSHDSTKTLKEMKTMSKTLKQLVYFMGRRHGFIKDHKPGNRPLDRDRLVRDTTKINI